MKRIALAALLALSLHAPGAGASVIYDFNDIDFRPLNFRLFGGLAIADIRIDGFIEVADDAAADGFLQQSELLSFSIETYNNIGTQVFTGSNADSGAQVLVQNLRIDDTNIFIDPSTTGTTASSLTLFFQRGPAFNDAEGILWSSVLNGERFGIFSPRDTPIVDVTMSAAGYEIDLNGGSSRGGISSTGSLDGLFLDPWLIATNLNPAPPPSADIPVPGTLALLMPMAALLAFGLRRGRAGHPGAAARRVA
jgi:hypothetical protein